MRQRARNRFTTSTTDCSGMAQRENVPTTTFPGPSLFGTRRSHVKRFVTAFSPLLCDLFWLPFPTGFWQNLYQRGEFAREFLRMVEEIRPHYSVRNWLVTAAMPALTFRHARPAGLLAGVRSAAEPDGLSGLLGAEAHADDGLSGVRQASRPEPERLRPLPEPPADARARQARSDFRRVESSRLEDPGGKIDRRRTEMPGPT